MLTGASAWLGETAQADGADAIHVQKGAPAPSVCSGMAGRPWRVLRGALRLEHTMPDGGVVQQLAVAGDIVGIETVLGEPFSCSAYALTSAVITPWPVPAGGPTVALLGQVVRQQQRQSADAARLRTGPAQARVTALLMRLGPCQGGGAALPERTDLPGLRDMSSLLDLAPETICRELAGIYPRSEPLSSACDDGRGKAARRHFAAHPRRPVVRSAG